VLRPIAGRHYQSGHNIFLPLARSTTERSKPAELSSGGGSVSRPADCESLLFETDALSH
jgi:hypothetical protein